MSKMTGVIVNTDNLVDGLEVHHVECLHAGAFEEATTKANAEREACGLPQGDFIHLVTFVGHCEVASFL